MFEIVLDAYKRSLRSFEVCFFVRVESLQLHLSHSSIVVHGAGYILQQYPCTWYRFHGC